MCCTSVLYGFDINDVIAGVNILDVLARNK